MKASTPSSWTEGIDSLIGGPPKLGFVIHYLYDWSILGEAAPPSAEKERPAVVILAIMKSADRVLERVTPITHG
jgi:hypothetical protein